MLRMRAANSAVRPDALRRVVEARSAFVAVNMTRSDLLVVVLAGLILGHRTKRPGSADVRPDRISAWQESAYVVARSVVPPAWMYVAGAAEDVLRVTLFRVFVSGRGTMGAQWAGGELALAGASRYISAEFP